MNKLTFYERLKMCKESSDISERNRMIPVLEQKCVEEQVAKSMLIQEPLLSIDNIYVTDFGSDEDYHGIDIKIKSIDTTFNCKSVSKENMNTQYFSGPIVALTDYLIFYDYCEFDYEHNTLKLPEYFYSILQDEYNKLTKIDKGKYNLIKKADIKNNSKSYKFLIREVVYG